jgi:predicted Co/Zn/Cd cation transporter (cation efflux family)
MNLLKKLSLAFAGIFSASVVICGLSIANEPIIEASSLQFHMGFGILAILFSFLTIALFARKTRTA